MMDYRKVVSSESLKLEKLKLQNAISKSVGSLKSNATETVMPEDRSMLHSDIAWIRYMAYGITAYKTYSSVRKVVSMFRGFGKRRR